MSTGFAFKQSLHLCSVCNLRIFLVFQLRTFEVGFSGLSRNGALGPVGNGRGVEGGGRGTVCCVNAKVEH